MTDMTITIRDKLTAAFAPTHIEVVDDSEKHRGHAGHKPGKQTHFSVSITAEAFRGQSPVARHRMVYDALKDELAGGVHALALDVKAP